MKILTTILLLISLTAQAQKNGSLKREQKVDTNLSHPKKIRPYIIPTLFITYGVVSLGGNPIRDLDLSTKAELTEDHPLFIARADDYTKFAPLVAMYGLDIAGVKGKNGVPDQTAMMLITTAISTTVVTSLKNKTHRLRPDGSSYNSFPSGHTTTVFAFAELLNQEFKDETPWIGYAGYTVAHSYRCIKAI
jgi:hypothetical protein